MKSIRILLTVTEGCPELYAALSNIPSRLRAERVRVLATIGVAAMSGGLASPDHAASAVDTNDVLAVSIGSESSLGKAQAIAKRLGGGL
ncbi:MAG: hypothetical protein FD157_3852 [Rhodocyclaceae bacterium]|nr:MAG: hypothetical protein FD157_3852 [Rhodocyclaceae bacterium]TND05454.1 MAG: hypothetical protein FD118_532 [Rhodocyclaceae bacterium]